MLSRPVPKESGNPASPTSASDRAASANVVRLHRSLGIGLVSVAGVFLVLSYSGIAPILPAGTVMPAVAYAPGAIVVALLGVVLFFQKPRAPACPPGLSVEEFWSNPEMGGKVVRIWFLLECGGLIAAVGYFVTGEPASAIAVGLMIAAYWLCGPNLFVRT